MILLHIFYSILAILGLGFLVFIHELGHYIAAKRYGMQIEIFSIGFGPVLYKWEFQQVRWQLCLLPFGGYVKIAGMEQKEGVDLRHVLHGFYGKTPLKRIGVAVAGPLANIVFAFFAFTLIWCLGGQIKPFQEITQFIGFVEPDSILQEEDVKSGDAILSFNQKRFEGYSDLLMKAALTGSAASLEGVHLNYLTREKTRFVSHLPSQSSPSERLHQLGILPAQHLIIEKILATSGQNLLSKGDRLLWANGHLLFCQKQLSYLLNEPTAFLTIKRGQTILHACVPRIPIDDLRLSSAFKHELDDWKYDLKIKDKLNHLYFIPYQMSSDKIIEEPLLFMNAEAEEVSLDAYTAPHTKLQAGDEIVAINGTFCPEAFDVFKALQDNTALLIVQKEKPAPLMTASEANSKFIASFKTQDIFTIVKTIGTDTPMTSLDNLHLIKLSLNPFSKLNFSPELRSQIEAGYAAQRKEIAKISDQDQRDKQLVALEKSEQRLSLGVLLKDQSVTYNPYPTAQFAHVFQNAWETLANFFTGSVTPKSMSGPVGIVQALQSSFSTSLTDALFWLGFVSLNLAVLNLLPIPVLDGGHIVFALIEIVTGKPVKIKTMERWVIPFLILLMLLFVYLTYQDIARLLQSLF